MTREERAAKREQRLREALAAKERELAQVQAQNQEAARAKLAKRQQCVGVLAGATGLLIWDDATLRKLFQILLRLREFQDPVGVLDALLTTWQQTGEMVLEDFRAARGVTRGDPDTGTPAAAGPFRLASAHESASLDVSTGGGGGCSPDQGEQMAWIGVSR
jgi:hypothetical protein